MSLTKKERMQLALLHEPVDRLPTQINYTQTLGQKLAQHYGIDERDLPEYFGNHLVRVDIQSESRFSEDGNVKYDWWGAGFKVDEEGYFPSVNPLAHSKDLEAYPWPDPNAPGLLDSASRIIKEDAGQHFIAPNFGFALFERAWALRGFDTFLLDMALDPDFVEELLERVLEIQLILIRRFIDLGVDGGYFGDDYGAQENMLFSPKMWRTFIKPRLAQMFAPFRETGLPISMHSDGQIQAIIPDLIEIGLTALNPVQPEVLDHKWLKSTFGNNLAYYGGISTQTVLPYGAPEDVRNAVRDCIKQLSPDGTGLVIAPSHRMMTDIPLENIDALLNAFSRLGG
ncbi:MAG: uroporphyrinogen decarboxylase family protein [Anaerolineales bacterium]